MAARDDFSTPEENLLHTHRQELKQLQAEVQRLKHSIPKGDKKRKKEVTNEIAQLEAKLKEKHAKELENLNSSTQVDAMTAAGHADTCQDGDRDANSSTSHNAGKKMSKAQKRREKKAQQDQEREERIQEQDVVNLSGARHLEGQKLKMMLTARNLAIYEIPSDGNCLYAAIADQQKRHDVQSTITSLRRDAAEHMRTHRDDFLPFLCKPDTSEPYTLEEYEEYCNRVQNTADWGGQLELRALSNVLQKPIEVVQAEAPVLIIGQEHPSQTLILSYHHHMYGLGAHYNSVVDKRLIPEEEAEEVGFT